MTMLDPAFFLAVNGPDSGAGLGTGLDEREAEDILDSYSRVDLAPVTELRRADDGKLVRVLERGDASALTKSGWRAPEPRSGCCSHRRGSRRAGACKRLSSCPPRHAICFAAPSCWVSRTIGFMRPTFFVISSRRRNAGNGCCGRKQSRSHGP